MTAARSLRALLLSLPLTLAITLDCTDIRDHGVSWNLKSLAGPKSVHLQESTPPSVHNTTFTIDICDPLKLNDNVAEKDQCPLGSRVCGQREIWEDGKLLGVDEVIPIAGQFTTEGRNLDPEPLRLKDSDSNEDSDKEGLRITLHGGRYPFRESSGMPQKAIVTFLCARNVTGLEGFEKKDDRKRSDDDDKQDDTPELPNLDDGKSLQVKSYKQEGDFKVLRLEWRTDKACEDAAGKEPEAGEPSKPSSHWGFFTWFIIVVFLLIATYIIFGSWLNYNRYGARGWDLIPHGDTIRDLPYILKDFFTGLAGRIQLGGSRGGYSAV